MKYFLFLATTLFLVSCGQSAAPSQSVTPDLPSEASESVQNSDESASGSENTSDMNTGMTTAPTLPPVEAGEDLGYTETFTLSGAALQVIERRKGTVGSLTVKALTDTNDLWTGEEVITAPITSSSLTDIDRDGKEEVLIFFQAASGSFTYASVVGYER